MKRDAPRSILAPVNRKHRECYCNIRTVAPAFRITVTVTACGQKQFCAGIPAVDTGGFRAPACSSISATAGIGLFGRCPGGARRRHLPVSGRALIDRSSAR